MKIKCKLLSHNKGLLVLETNSPLSIQADAFYTVDIKPYRNSRSLEQNSLLWALIQQLSEETGNDPMDIYIAALEKADAKYEWIAALESAEDDLKRIFRAIKPFGCITTETGKTLVRYKCWIGSSKFDSREMTQLIDYIQGELEND